MERRCSLVCHPRFPVIFWRTSACPGIALPVLSDVRSPNRAMEALILYPQDRSFATRHIVEMHEKLHERAIQRQKRLERIAGISLIEDSIAQLTLSTLRSHFSPRRLLISKPSKKWKLR
jgi:hypothetical protein